MQQGPIPETARGDAEAALLTLSVLEGPNKGQVFPFSGHETFLVGRSKQAHLQLTDAYFSRFHFLVEINPPSSRLTDLGSRNGTHVNDQRTQLADLRHGDVITAGRTKLLVSIPTLSQDKPATVAEVASPEAQTMNLAPGQGPAGGMAPRQAAPEQLTLTSPPGEAPRPQITPMPARAASPKGEAAKLKTTEPVAAANMPQVPGYTIVRELGRGGMGVVYLARNKQDNAPVAIKMILPDGAANRKQKERFLREAQILCQLRHKYVVAFREMGETEDYLFFTMDYVEGTDAHHMLKEQGPLPVREATRMLCQVLTALDYAHAKGYVHRDIKPQNVFIAREGGKKVVKVGDFGLARVYQQSRLSGLTMQGEMGGTISFMPPEQLLNFREAKPAADQYSAAAMLYTLLTNRYLFDFENARGRELALILQDEPVPIRERRADLPGELAAVIHRALAKEPAARFDDVMAFRSALMAFAK